MKTKIAFFALIYLFLSLLIWAQPYEITEVDIFSLGKLPSGIEVSVQGVSIGDSMEMVLKKFKKKQKHVKTRGAGGFMLDVVEEAFRVFFTDNHVVSHMVLWVDFKGNLKGKTAEYFDLLSDGRMKSFLEGYFGKPDYVYQSTSGFEMYNMYYLNGFVFMRFLSNPQIMIGTEESVLSDVERWGAKKVGEAEKEIPRPKMSTVGFRETLWGMSKEQVKKVETSWFIKEEKGGGDFKGLDVLYYKTEVGSLEAVIICYFAENLLTRARYQITEEHASSNLYIDDFKNIKSQLTQKYGAPARDDAIWSNDLYKDEPSEYGMAVSVGHLMYVAEWYLPETSIQLLLRGDNYKITLSVEYTGDNFGEFEKKVRERAKKDIW